MYLYVIYIKKMKQKTKEFLFHKKECNRSKVEKACRDVVCYGVTIFAALMGFLLIDANANLANAESDFASSKIVVAHVD